MRDDGDDITYQIPGAEAAGIIVKLHVDEDASYCNPRENDGNATLYTVERDYQDYDERSAKGANIDLAEGYPVIDDAPNDEDEPYTEDYYFEWDDDWNETAKRLKAKGCEVVLVMRDGYNGGMSCFNIDDYPYAGSACGVLYLTPDQIRERFVLDKDAEIPEELRVTAYNSLIEEINEYSDWATGEVYGYVISRSVRGREGAELDSCWGCIGHKWAIEAATYAAKYWIDTPEGSKAKECAERIAPIMDAYAVAVGDKDGDNETMLADLLADLMHWADSIGEDFPSCLETAAGHYKDESGNDVL